MSWLIKVPATTANLGAGFDSVGVALNLYLSLKVDLSEKWRFVPLSEGMDELPRDEGNLIYQIALQTAKQFGYLDLPACNVEMTSNIPLTRGLGSSATAIIAGIELAVCLLDLNLSKEEKLEIATAIEGHPDNVAPSLLGGCVIGHYDQEVDWIHVPIHDLVFLAIIPDFELKTKEARAVLPKSFSYKESVQASSVANVSVAAICRGDWITLGNMMRKDHFHQPYRKKLVPHYDKIVELLDEEVYGTFLSGAGPTLIALTSKEVIERKLADWQTIFPKLNWLPLEVENRGVITTKL
ncbi:homoserine kinase [Paraliobacillus quinghaiensis]|uniref:Homoserine kinase n=1 Tax=Paraliobacillus quinghaiensis TaxID=470815 RepID=A0A917WVT7_9BACI|nr:homoserine kinase [Paraliobacillus quinghaiensis]GGM37212.1 homoserine kinase [Paraliobacillus quinghaiensis]